MSRADVLALAGSAIALAVLMHAVGASRPSSLLAAVAFGLIIVVLACMVTASDTLAEILGAVGMLTALSGLLGIVARLPVTRARSRYACAGGSSSRHFAATSRKRPTSRSPRGWDEWRPESPPLSTGRGSYVEA